MSTTTTEHEIRGYLDAVAAHLDDLPPAERREILEDLELHLREVAAEGDGSLTDRLGPADAYAEELRVSAGLPGRGGRESPGTVSKLLSRLDSALASPRAVQARAFLAELRPGWWVLRGYLAVASLSVLTYSITRSDFPVPRLLGSPVWGFVAIGAAVWASVSLGRRAETVPLARRASVLASVVVVLAALAAVGNVRGVLMRGPAEQVFVVEQPAEEIAGDVCAYAPDGTAVERVLLFDESGRPIVGGIAVGERTIGTPLPGGPAAQPNAFPQTDPASCPPLASVTVTAEHGECWTLVTAGGRALFRATLAPGESRTFLAPELSVVLGNAGAVRVVANGTDLGVPGLPGGVYRGTFTKETTALPPHEPAS